MGFLGVPTLQRLTVHVWGWESVAALSCQPRSRPQACTLPVHPSVRPSLIRASSIYVGGARPQDSWLEFPITGETQPLCIRPPLPPLERKGLAER